MRSCLPSIEQSSVFAESEMSIVRQWVGADLGSAAEASMVTCLPFMAMSLMVFSAAETEIRHDESPVARRMTPDSSIATGVWALGSGTEVGECGAIWKLAEISKSCKVSSLKKQAIVAGPGLVVRKRLLGESGSEEMIQDGDDSETSIEFETDPRFSASKVNCAGFAGAKTTTKIT